MSQSPQIEVITPRVQRVFSAIFGRQLAFSVDLQRANEPAWTSLKHVEFLIALELEFGVRFDGADATDVTSMPVLLDRLQSKMQ
jgi:acyl carrier protein